MIESKTLSMNTKPVIKRIAVKVKCELTSPALIGSGLNEYTDSDIIRDGNGVAYLPGSTIAGVMCSLLPKAKELFSELNGISPLWVYDAKLINAHGQPANVIELDGIELDRENKVALNMSKFDYEAVETGTVFTLRFLLTLREKGDRLELVKTFKTLIGALESGDVAFGAKTRRGFGAVRYISAMKREFDLSKGNIDDLVQWIEFDWDVDEKYPELWEHAESEEFSDNMVTLTATLRLEGSIMIRDTRNVYQDLSEGEQVPDYKHKSINGKPVILGTSWAGAFKSGLYRLLRQRDISQTDDYLDYYFDDVFGFVPINEDDTEALTSKIIFKASLLEKSNKHIDGYRSITRVKIDRFTGGAATGALFTEKPWYGGHTTLVTRYPKERADIRELIILGLDAVNRGLIQIGGETAIGRGFFSVTHVTDQDGQVYEENELCCKLFAVPKMKLRTELSRKTVVEAGETA